MTGPASYAASAPNCATKSCLSVRAHIRKHADAMRKMLAVAAIEYLSPVEFAVRHKASSALVRATSAALQTSGDSKVPGSGLELLLHEQVTHEAHEIGADTIAH